MSPEEVRNEIRTVILFYEYRGWDWLDVIHFLLWRHRGEH